MSLRHLHKLTSVQRSRKSNYQLGGYLAFVAGAINAGGFLAISRYTSHITGTISGITDDIALNHWTLALGGVAMVLAFMLGAGTTSLLVNWGQRRQIYSQFALPIMLEALLILTFGFFGNHFLHHYAFTVPFIALILSFTMGLQNAIITKISSAEIRTTHMTGMVTDLGIELGQLVYRNRSQALNKNHIVRANRSKLKAYTMMISCFFLGGLAGAFAFKHFGFISVVPIALSLIAISALQLWRDGEEFFRAPPKTRVHDVTKDF